MSLVISFYDFRLIFSHPYFLQAINNPETGRPDAGKFLEAVSNEYLERMCHESGTGNP